MFEDEDEEEDCDGDDEEESKFGEAAVLALLIGLNIEGWTSSRFLVASLTLSTVRSMFSSILSSRLPCSMTRLCSSRLRALRELMERSIFVAYWLRYRMKVSSISSSSSPDSHCSTSRSITAPCVTSRL